MWKSFLILFPNSERLYILKNVALEKTIIPYIYRCIYIKLLLLLYLNIYSIIIFNYAVNNKNIKRIRLESF